MAAQWKSGIQAESLPDRLRATAGVDGALGRKGGAKNRMLNRKGIALTATDSHLHLPCQR
jgi:hypothetical protein